MGGYIGGNGGVTQVDGYSKTEVDSKVADKVEDSKVLTDVPANAVFTDTTYSIRDGELSQNNFTDADHTKLNAIEASADVTDTTNVVSALTAGSNITIAANGTISSTDTNTTYSVQDGELSQNNFTNADHTKLNSIETNADVTDTTNVVAALTAGTNVAIAANGTISSTDTNTTYSVGDNGLTQRNFTNTFKAKLEGIESGATADQTKADIDALNINADTLDGQHGSYYTGYTDTAVSNIVNSAPGTLDTLNELAAALGDDANFSTTVTNSIATKLPLSGGTMTGNLVLNGSTARIYDTDNYPLVQVNASKAYFGSTSRATTTLASSSTITHTRGSNTYQIFTDNYHPNADKWTTARTLSLSGQASGSASWDGSANATLSVTLNDSALDDQYVTVGSRYTGNADSLVQTNKASIRLWDVSTATDDPSGANDGLVLSAGWDSTSWGVQQFHDFHTNDLYLRSKQNGTFSGWEKVWSEGNDGSGSGLDADLLDGVQGSNYLRSNTSDTINGDLTITGTNALICDGIDSGNPTAGTDDLRVSGYGILGNRATLYFTNSGGAIQFGVGSNHNASVACTIDASKNFTAQGNVTAYSDERLKDNISTIDGALDKINSIRGVTYNRNDLKDNPRQTGVIAQEVEKVLPEVVCTDDEGVKTVAYGNMVGLLIEAIKELKAEIEELKAR